MLQAPRKKFIPDHHPIKLTAIIYYQSRRSDLSAELLCDLIEKAGIIENDRLIFKKDIEKRIDPKNPRVIFRLEKFVENTGADNDNL